MFQKSLNRKYEGDKNISKSRDEKYYLIKVPKTKEFVFWMKKEVVARKKTDR